MAFQTISKPTGEEIRQRLRFGNRTVNGMVAAAEPRKSPEP